MERDRQLLLVPKRLDDPMKFFFWDFDIALAFILGFSLGLLLGSLVLATLLGGGAGFSWSKLRTGRHPGYALHFLYWHLPIRLFDRTPPSARRIFCG